MILALDPSSTACGWAVFEGTKLFASGCVRRRKKSARRRERETVDQYAYRVGAQLAEFVIRPEDKVYYEINNAPQRTLYMQQRLAIAHDGRGRILKALGVEGIPVQADNKPKKKRRINMTLIYRLGKASEDEIDAIALGHRVVSGTVKEVAQ